MTAEDLTMKFGGGVICKCGVRKDPRLVMCNACMVRTMNGPEEAPAVADLKEKACTRTGCTRLARPGSLFCKPCQGSYIRNERRERRETVYEKHNVHQNYTDPGHRAAQNYWRQEMEKYGEDE